MDGFLPVGGSGEMSNFLNDLQSIVSAKHIVV